MRKEAEDKGIYYGSYADFLKSKGASLGAAGNSKMDIANLNAVKTTFATLQKSASSMSSPNYGKSPEELWALAERMVMGGGGGALAPTTVQWGSLGAPTKP